jgi:hypothetical protein
LSLALTNTTLTNAATHLQATNIYGYHQNGVF